MRNDYSLTLLSLCHMQDSRTMHAPFNADDSNLVMPHKVNGVFTWPWGTTQDRARRLGDPQNLVTWLCSLGDSKRPGLNSTYTAIKAIILCSKSQFCASAVV